MLSKKTDDDFINIIVGNNAGRELSYLEVQLLLVQSACIMALEGITRVSASQIASKAFNDYGIEATPSFTGQTFCSLGFSSVTIHGKKKVVLDADGLEVIRQDVTVQCEKAIEKMRVTIAKFQDLPKKIKKLQREWKQALSLKDREQELIKLINEGQQKPSRLSFLEAEAKRIHGQAARSKELERECQELSETIKLLPKLEQRKASLEAAISKYRAEEKEFADKEAQLKQMVAGLKVRMGLVTLVTIEQRIHDANIELKQLSMQIDSKRSLLDKILHRDRGNR